MLCGADRLLLLDDYKKARVQGVHLLPRGTCSLSPLAVTAPAMCMRSPATYARLCQHSLCNPVSAQMFYCIPVHQSCVVLGSLSVCARSSKSSIERDRRVCVRVDLRFVRGCSWTCWWLAASAAA
eukprot:5120533-Pleurochrysis_carterae.AAC.1